jgi:hypothetical protein
MKFCCQSQNVTRKAAQNDVCTKKARKKMLMKLTADGAIQDSNELTVCKDGKKRRSDG